MFGLGNDGNNDVMKSVEQRNEKSLLNTFPFIQQKTAGHANDHNHDQQQHHGTHDHHAEHSHHDNRNRSPVREPFSSKKSGQSTI